MMQTKIIIMIGMIAAIILAGCASTGSDGQASATPPMMTSELLSDLDTALAPGTHLTDVKKLLGSPTSSMPGMMRGDKVHIFEIPGESGEVYKVTVIIMADKTVRKHQVYKVDSSGRTSRL